MRSSFLPQQLGAAWRKSHCLCRGVTCAELLLLPEALAHSFSLQGGPALSGKGKTALCAADLGRKELCTGREGKIKAWGERRERSEQQGLNCAVPPPSSRAGAGSAPCRHRAAIHRAAERKIGPYRCSSCKPCGEGCVPGAAPGAAALRAAQGRLSSYGSAAERRNAGGPAGRPEP